jgi:hypothetical protein
MNRLLHLSAPRLTVLIERQAEAPRQKPAASASVASARCESTWRRFLMALMRSLSAMST